MKGRDERTEESLASSYFIHSSIERERRLLDEGRGKWIVTGMKMIAQEKERELGMEYRVNQKAVAKKPATELPEKVNEMLVEEHTAMEVLLLCEVREWEQLFWNKFKAFLDLIGKYRVAEKERLTREWKANCWKRLNTQMHAALKRMADVEDMKDEDSQKFLAEQWAYCISLLFEGVDNQDLFSLSKARRDIVEKNKDDEMKEILPRIEQEIEDIEFRLKRGSDLGRFDQFWGCYTLFNCRYSRSKWLGFYQNLTVPLEVYSHYQKGNNDITHLTFCSFSFDFDVNRLLSDLPRVTSISRDPNHSVDAIPPVPRDLLFIKSNDLNTFAKEIKLYPSSTYFFSEVGYMDGVSLGNNARVLISFVPPTSGERLTLRVKHSGEENAPLEVTLGSIKIQLDPSSKSSLTIDDITLYPIQLSDPSESDHLSFVPEVRNDIFIHFRKNELGNHILHDIELLDEAGLVYMPHSASLSKRSN